MFSWDVAFCLSPGARGAVHCPPPHQPPRGTEHGYTPCYFNMLIVWPEVIFLFYCSVYVHGDVFQPLRFLSSGQFEGCSNCFSSPPSLSLPDTTVARKKCRHTTIKMLSAMTETVIRKQTTQGCYNRSMAEFHFASWRHWELRKLLKGIFSSHTSASLCSLTRGQLLMDNMHSLMCL